MSIEDAYDLVSTESNGYTRVSNYYKRTHICAICGDKCDYTEVHHIDKNPRNFTPDNLIELCLVCHKRIHKGASVKAVKPSIIKAITYYGKEDVYDIEMNAPYHNYVANGFVVHNCVESQRYVNENADEEGIRFIRPLFYTGENESSLPSRVWKHAMEDAESDYNLMILYGVKNQDARKVLPNSTACTIIMDVNLRELRHIYSLRSSPAAYPEMRELMRLLKAEVDKVLPGFLPEKEE